MASPPTLLIPQNKTPRALFDFQNQLRAWNIYASRLPPQSGHFAYGDFPILNTGVHVNPFPARPGLPMTATQVSALLLVASYMDPLDLFHLARLCRPMHVALMKKANRHIWRAVLRKYPSFPPCPRHLIEPYYVSLIYGRECHACGQHCDEFQARMWAKHGWLLCDVCLEHNLVDAEELLSIYGKAIPDRPTGVQLPPQTPRDALRLLLPLSGSDFRGDVKVDYYYRPEAETVMWQYIRPMEELLRHSGSETIRNMMFESRSRHVRHVEEFADDIVDCFNADTESSLFDVPTLREKIGDAVDITARGYELEDLQRQKHAFSHDKFLDQLLTDEEVWKDAEPRIWQVLSDKRSTRISRKVLDGEEDVILLCEEMLAEMPLSEEQRMQLPNQRHMALPHCLTQLRLDCDEPPTREQFKTVVPALKDAIDAYIAALPGTFLVTLDQFFDRNSVLLRDTPYAPEPEAAKAARLLGTAAAMFTYRYWTKDQAKVVLPFPDIHGHWRTHYPRFGWDVVPSKEVAGQGVCNPGVLHMLMPYAPSLMHLRDMRFRDDIPLAEMDQLVREGRVQCVCRISRLAHHRDTWGWAKLLAHCEYEHSQWMRIWGGPQATGALGEPLTNRRQRWGDDHVRAGQIVRYYEGDVPEHLRHSRSTLLGVENILHANSDRRLLGCKICYELAGAQDRSQLEVFRGVPGSSASREPLDIAHHFRVRHKIKKIVAEYLLFDPPLEDMRMETFRQIDSRT